MRFSRPLALVAISVGFQVWSTVRAPGQSIQLTNVQVTSATVQLQIAAPSNAYYRVDSSPDLASWLPVDYYFGSNGLHTTVDTSSQTNGIMFYRAVQVASTNVQVIDYGPGPVTPGGQITVYGQFLPPLSQYTAQVNGVNAPILSGTSARLLIKVPTNAGSGVITITTSAGSVESSEAVTVLSNAVVRFQPPAGLVASNFVIANNYGTGVLISNTAADYSIPVREGFPTLNFAAVPGQGSNLFFCAMSFGGEQLVLMNANSTAAALVFQDWNFCGTDPTFSATLMAIIQTNAAVENFASVLATAMVNDALPYQDPTVTNAYQAAVISVYTNESFASLPAPALAAGGKVSSGAKTPDDASTTTYQIYPVINAAPPGSVLTPSALQGTGRLLEVTGNGLNFNVSSPDYLFNPVDWIVSFEAVDVDATFPNGKSDFDTIWQNTEYTPLPYTTNGLFYAQRSVGANLFSSRLNLTGLLLKSVTGLFTPKVNTSVAIPPGDAAYVVRGVGPSFFTPPDFAYVQNQMPVEYLETLVVNVSAVAFQLLGQMTDDKTTQALIKSIGEYNGLVTTVIQQGPIQSVDDFKRTVYTILKDIIKDYVKDQVKDSAGAAVDFAAKNFVSAQTLLDAATGPLGALKKASTVGQIGERLIGLTDTTALETSFIVVGDPFALNNVQMVPATAAPGQTVTVSFKGSTRLRAFNPNNASDAVEFIGNTFFKGQVRSVAGPDASGTQTLAVAIPENINSNYYGAFTLYVLTQGRKGSASVTVTNAAALSNVSPLEGFAPAASFNGSPFPGTAVRLQGALFTASDTFLFTAGNSTVAATSVHANGSEPGDVTVNVPAGATTGPIQILHATTGNPLPIPGPVFTVLGFPVILNVEPYPGAPVGAILDMIIHNAGHNPSLIYLTFPGGYPQNPIVQADGTVSVLVPYGVQTGPGNLTVVTPGGSNYIAFTVYPPPPVNNLTAGGNITIGGSSIITLARAIAFADGSALPTTAEAQSGVSTYYIDTNHPSAWKLGPAYTHVFMGTSSDDGNFDVSFDSIFGTYGGNVVFSGNNNNIYGTFQGPLTLSGVSNYLGSGTVNGPVTISGNYNSVGQGYFHGAMTVSGVENSFSLPTFQNVPSAALTILSNFNSGSFNFQSNAGDGLVINGGKFNQITVNQSVGNTGNGATLTGGAEGNRVTIATGVLTNQYFGVAGSGNLGHGVALIGSAIGNVIQPLEQSLSGNGLDGIYMDGAGVISNTFSTSCSFNGGNGVTIINGASFNTIGTVGPPFFSATGSQLPMDYNGGSGVFCGGCGPNQLAVLTRTNGQYGVLISGVKAPSNNFYLVTSSQAVGSINVSGNGYAGLRLEAGASGIQAYATLGMDQDGLELDGEDVTNNVIIATSYSAIGQGAVLRNGANSNNLTLGVSASSLNGILLDDVSNNLVQVFSSTSNRLSGICLTNGAQGNYILGSSAPALNLGDSVGGGIDYNLVDGCLVSGGSSNNIVDSLACYFNSQDGVAFSGAGVSGNEAIRLSVSDNGRDGVRFELGASDNTLGSDPSLNPASPTDINIGLVGSANVEAGVMITDPGTASNVIQGVYVGGHLTAILAQNQAGIGQIHGCLLEDDYNGIVLQGEAHDGTISGLTVEFNTNAGVIVSNAWNVLIGGIDAASANTFFGNPTAIDIGGAAASNNVIENNVIRDAFAAPGNNGIFLHDGATQNQIVATNFIESFLCGVRIESASNNLVSQLVVEQNPGPGIIIAAGATGNQIEQNVIEYNSVGVLVSDAGSVGNSIRGNSIFYNTGKGIELSAGGNNQIAPPTLPAYTNLIINGTSTAPDGSIVEIFWDPYDQGEVFLGGGPVLGGRFRVNLDVDPTTLGYPHLDATVTDPDGNTSEFSGLSQQLLILPDLAFTATNSTGQRQVFYSTDGASPPVNLTETWNAASDNFSPALPGGVSCGQLLFVSLVSGNDAIYVMNPQSTAAPQLVTGNPAGDYNPAWLIPCQRIVFVSQRDGNPQIYAINLNGTGLQRLTTNSFADISPAPTLDGSKIVFISNRSGSNTLWMMNSDGTNPTQVGGVTGTPSQPAVSPDGTTIALAATVNGVSEIALVHTDGTGFTKLTSDGAHATHPTWLPDGQHLIFSSDRAGAIKLYSIATGGSTPQALNLSPNIGTEPSAAGE